MTDEQLPPSPDPAPGTRLREAREQAGISLQQVADRTLIPLARLQALEQDRYDAVGSSAYVNGYTRAYARAIGVQPDGYVAEFDAALEWRRQQELALEPAPVSGATEWSDNQRKLWLASMATAVIMGVVLALLIIYRLGSSDAPSPTAQTSSPQARDSIASPPREERPQPLARADEEQPAELTSPPQTLPQATPDARGEMPSPEAVPEVSEPELQTAAPPAPTPAPRPEPTDAEQGEYVLEMSFTDDCWVEVHDANGDRVVARLAQSGDNLRLSGQAPFNVLLGNAWAASLALDGEPVTISPRPGRNSLRLQVGP